MSELARRRRAVWAGVAGTAAAAVLASGLWLVWLVPGPILAAVVGIGPADGVMTLQSCGEATDAEGYSEGTACTGLFRPYGSGDAAPRRIELRMAAEGREPGMSFGVRLAYGTAYEFSGPAVSIFGTAAGLMLSPFLTVAAWLSSCARHARRPEDGGTYALAWCAGAVVLIVLALVAHLLIGVVQWIF